MGRSLRTLVLALSVGTLLLGLCLPCANLLGSPGRPATGKSCCKKNGECQKVPSKDSSSRKPCPLQKAANATIERVQVRAPQVQFVGASLVAPMPIVQVPFERHSRTDAFSPPYTPLHLYLLNSSLLI